MIVQSSQHKVQATKPALVSLYIDFTNPKFSFRPLASSFGKSQVAPSSENVTAFGAHYVTMATVFTQFPIGDQRVNITKISKKNVPIKAFVSSPKIFSSLSSASRHSHSFEYNYPFNTHSSHSFNLFRVLIIHKSLYLQF